MLLLTATHGMHSFGARVERQVRDENTLVIVYDWANKTRRDANENIFTAKNLQAMCETEHVLLAHEEYKDHCQLHYEEKANVSSTCESPQGSIAYHFYNVSGRA